MGIQWIEAPPIPPDDEGRMEEHIITNPISRSRVEAFRSEYIADRAKSDAVETLFRTRNAYDEEPEWNSQFAFGFNVLIHKGPFVEGSNWLPYHTWEFALAAERHLMHELQQMLEAAELVEEPVQADADALVHAFDRLTTMLTMERFAPSLLVISAGITPGLQASLWERTTPDWQLSSELKKTWITGAHRGLPILRMDDGEPNPNPSLFAVDLRAFARLRKYGTETELEVSDIGEDLAREMLAARPELVPNPPPGGAEEERIRQLRMKAHLRLSECYSIELQNGGAVRRVSFHP